MTDPKLPNGTNYCLCPSCGEYFTNVGNFDKHRQGKPTARVCVDPSSLVTKAGKRRLRLNGKGYWAKPGGFHG